MAIMQLAQMYVGPTEAVGTGQFIRPGLATRTDVCAESLVRLQEPQCSDLHPVARLQQRQDVAGYAMRVHVGPAKRPGNERTIFNQPLGRQEIAADGDEVCLSFCAVGIYDGQSQYRYTMKFSRSELLSILAIGGTDQQPEHA